MKIQIEQKEDELTKLSKRSWDVKYKIIGQVRDPQKKKEVFDLLLELQDIEFNRVSQFYRQHITR